MALQMKIKNVDLDLTIPKETDESGVRNPESGEEVPRSWTLSGFADYDKRNGKENLVLSGTSNSGTDLPLVAVAPVLLTGFGEWIGAETPFKVALESLDRGDLAITRRLDFPKGDTLRNMREGILAKTLVSKSCEGESGVIELETGVSVGDIKAAEIQEFFNVTRLLDWEESIHHFIKGKKHILTGHAFLVFEDSEGQQIRAKMTSTWNFATKDGDEAQFKEKVHSVRRSVETKLNQFGDVVTEATSKGTTLYES